MMSRSQLTPWRRTALASRAVDPFTTLQSEMNRLFSGLFNGDEMWAAPGEGTTVLAPRLDVSETDKDIQLTVELPGLAETDVEVELLDEAVRIYGEKKDERETKDHNFHRTERSFGSFERVVPLPKPIQREGVVATFKNGVLSVVLPKATPNAAHQKITVQPG